MTNPLNKLNTAAKAIRLSSDEKAVMRARIFEAIEGGKYAPQKSSVVITASSFSWLSMRFTMPIAVLLIVALGSSTTYAAKGSLPGGILYPVKIYVNEKVAGALAVSDEAKLSYHTSVAQTRLEEAEALASQGKLDASATQELESNFNAHVEAADSLASSLEEKDPSAGVEAKITLDSSLSAHESILSRLGQDSADEETKSNSDSFAMRLRSRGTLAMAGSTGAPVMLKATAPVSAKMQTMSLSAPANQNNEVTEEASSSTAADTHEDGAASLAQKKVALQLQKKATQELARARDAYADEQDSLDATTTGKVEAQLAELDTQAEVGDDQVRAGGYEEARATFTLILKESVELRALVEASAKYDADFVKPSLGGWGSGTWNGDNGSDDDGGGDSGDGDLRGNLPFSVPSAGF
ncbi:MAG TPA: DUF5667 domain-containing protein [Candidatus Paceibacterota bacterium]|nr:DUF5667 domain-containing protein [Candidatus Paceibacterota bacterium]